jgi:hypothetical protein
VLIGTDFTPPFIFNWETEDVSNGTHSIGTKVYDAMDDQCESAVDVQVEDYIYLSGRWEGEYQGYDPNMKKGVTIRRKLTIFPGFNYTDTIWGKPDNMASFIIYQCEKGNWEVIDAGATMEWSPTEAKRIDIGNGGKLVFWQRPPHVDPVILNSARDEWSFRDTELEPDVDYYLKTQ